MIKRITSLITAALLVATMAMGSLAAPAFAAPPCPAGSDTDRATSTGEPGQFECVTTTEGKNKKFKEEETITSTGAPNDNKEGKLQESDTGCADSNPGNSCPPGQFNNQ